MAGGVRLLVAFSSSRFLLPGLFLPVHVTAVVVVIRRHK
jgi:hypothetical protein